MRIRVQPNVPDAWVLGAIVVAGAGIVLAISALRLGAADPRPAGPLSAPTAVPTALTTTRLAVSPASSARSSPGRGPARAFRSGLSLRESRLSPDAAVVAQDSRPSPPDYRLSDQD